MADRPHHRIHEDVRHGATPSPEPVAAVVVAPEPEPMPEPVAPPPMPSAQTMPSAHVMPAPAAPTLAQAFTTLCGALQGHLDDNLVMARHCEEIQAWHANAGGDERHPNSIMAWRHAVSILAEVLGQPMTLG